VQVSARKAGAGEVFTVTGFGHKQWEREIMSDKLKEQVSAFVDGELSAAEQRLLLARLGRDGELKRSWQNFHLIGAALRDQLPECLDAHLAERVSTAIEREAGSAPGGRSYRNWQGLLKPVAGFAIAASVAVIAVLGVRHFEPGPGQGPVIATAPVTSPERGYVRVGSGDREGRSTRTADYLSRYLVSHNEYAASSGMRGMLPYVRIVGYDSGN
jgi:sigma-E factor negative regulatory protein RseA